jgi:hypothetical protein
LHSHRPLERVQGARTICSENAMRESIMPANVPHGAIRPSFLSVLGCVA